MPKPFLPKTQTALATAKLLWKQFYSSLWFSRKKLLQIREEIFESELIGHLCQLAGVQKLRTSPYHPQTNGQCERFNGTLLNMLGTLPQSRRRTGKVMSLLWYMLIIAPGIQPLGLALFFVIWKGA